MKAKMKITRLHYATNSISKLLGSRYQLRVILYCHCLFILTDQGAISLVEVLFGQFAAIQSNDIWGILIRWKTQHTLVEMKPLQGRLPAGEK